jgi:hypothetical protein
MRLLLAYAVLIAAPLSAPADPMDDARAAVALARCRVDVKSSPASPARSDCGCGVTGYCTCGDSCPCEACRVRGRVYATPQPLAPYFVVPQPTPTKNPANLFVSAQPRRSYITGGGHTHTCKACGTTWGGPNHGHNCPTCGRVETTHDPAGSQRVAPSTGRALSIRPFVSSANCGSGG